VPFPSFEAYLGMARLRWRSEHTMRARLGFGWTAARHGHYDRVHEVVPPRVRRRFTRRVEEPPAPPWIGRLLSDSGPAKRE
jgi:hypothetical protein